MGKAAEFIKRRIDNIKLKRKMTFVWLTSVAVILIFAVWGNRKITQSYDDTLYSVMVDSMNYALTEISGQLENYETLGEALFRNSDIQEILSAAKESGKVYWADYETVRQRITTESNRYDYINYVVLVDETTGATFGDTTNMDLNAEEKEYILKRAEENGKKSVWITSYGSESQMILTRTIPSIENLGKDNLGTLIINIDIASLIRDTGVSEQKNFRCVLVDEEGNSLSDRGEYTNAQIKELYRQIKDQKFAVAAIDGKQYFAVYQEEQNEDWGYVYFTDYDEIFREINNNLRRVVLVCGICVLLIVILNSFFTRDILSGFGGLIQAFQAFAKDISHPQPQEHSRRKDEIGTLYQQFDLMQEKVVQLIREKYVIELKRKRAQVEMLETQMNPHFLYNTLQTIDWRAKALHSEEISRMVEALSQILQITLSNKKSFITVEEELYLVQQFVTIQQIRMENELVYEVLVEPELLDVMIPKLIIQPLVENGISHSMNAMLEVTRIVVDVRREGEEIAIYVKNNGSRFPDNLLSKLSNKEIQPIGHGIGILNIDTRIKLTYGETYGIIFYNEEEYAVAKLLFPVERKE